MNYREVEIAAPKDLGTTGTEIIDIDISDILSCIELIWQTTVVTVSVMTDTHPACISKVELIDGSDVLLSLSGEELMALAFYTGRTMPLEEISLTVGEYMRSVIPIYFGRMLMDPQLAFDPKKFKNPQLKVTWDEDAANASVVANELTVRGWAFDQKVPSPMGFLMSKEIKSYTPAANSYEYTDMPTDYPYRLLMIQSEATDKNPFEVLNLVKLSEEHDKRIPIDMTGYEVFRKIIQPRGLLSIPVTLDAAITAKTLYLPPTYAHGIKIEYDATAFVTASSKFALPTFTNTKIALAASVDIKALRALVTGYAPYSCLAIPFGDLDDIGDWYDVTKLGHLRLTTQGAAAVGTSPVARICLQQLRKY